MLVIGLTGPTGAGKGVVSSVFAAHGVPVIDADAIYHQLLIPPSSCLNELVYAFGTQILAPDGTLDRKRLGSIVFADEPLLKRLNEITHRYVMASVKARLEQLRSEEIRAVILDAPQLFEAEADKLCHVIVSVLADKETRVERIIHRDGIDREAAMRRIAAQKSDDFFRTHSDYTVENNGNLSAILPTVRRILEQTGVIAV